MILALFFGWYFSVILKILSERDQHFFNVQFFVFEIGCDCQVRVSCFCVYLFLSWSYPVIVLRCRFFSFSLSRSLYLLIFWYFPWVIYDISTDISNKRHVLFIVLNNYTESVNLYFYVRLDSKVPDNSSFFCLLLVLVGVYTIFYISIFHSIYIFSIKYNLFFHTFLYTLSELFTPALVDGLSMESEWQQTSSDPQNSSQNSFPSKQCCILEDFDLSSNLQLFQSLSISLRTVPSVPNTVVFLVLWQGPSTIFLFRFLLFSVYGPLGF